jgi:Mg-chelatase subunit ChlD
MRALLERTWLEAGKRAELHLVTELCAIGKPVDNARPSLSVVFVLDTSGSMQGEPLLQVQRSVHTLVDLLAPEDKVGVVAFSSAAIDVAALQALTPDARKAIKRRVDGMAANGGTNMEAGLALAKKMLGARGAHERQVIVLLSDGQPNQGLATADGLAKMVEGMRPDVSTTTLGYGLGHSADLLNAIAIGGGGQYWFIPDPEEAQMELARAIGAQGDVVADAVELAFTPGEGVEIAEIYDKKPRFTKDGIVVSAPDLRENGKHVVVARLLVDVGREPGAFALATISAKHRAGGRDHVVRVSHQVDVRHGAPELVIEAHTFAELALAEGVRRQGRAAADAGNFDVAVAILRKQIARLEAIPGYKAMDGSPLSEAVEQLVDEVTLYGTRPSKELYAGFRSTQMGLDLGQGAQHAADMKMQSDRSQRLIVGAAGGGTNAVNGHVIITEKNGVAQRIPLGNEMTIGRVQGNDICLSRGNISKRHTRLVVRDGKVIVVDLKTTNGTFVNGKRISAPHVMGVGDKVYVGDFTLEVEIDKKP